jgi:hypothetical protein
VFFYFYFICLPYQLHRRSLKKMGSTYSIENTPLGQSLIDHVFELREACMLVLYPDNKVLHLKPWKDNNTCRSNFEMRILYIPAGQLIQVIDVAEEWCALNGTYLRASVTFLNDVPLTPDTAMRIPSYTTHEAHSGPLPMAWSEEPQFACLMQDDRLCLRNTTVIWSAWPYFIRDMLASRRQDRPISFNSNLVRDHGVGCHPQRIHDSRHLRKWHIWNMRYLGYVVMIICLAYIALSLHRRRRRTQPRN